MNTSIRGLSMIALMSVLIFPLASMAQEKTSICSYTGSPEWAGAAPTIEKTCTDAGSPMETCSDFRLKFAGGVVVTADELGIPKTDGELSFIPVDFSFVEETVGGDGYGRWRLYLSEPGGGNSAQERWMVFDDGGKKLSGLMDGAELAKWTAERREPGLWVDEPVFLTETCK